MKPTDLDPGVEPHLTIQGLSRRYGAFAALDGVSLSVRKGEFLCLLGPSGCGKTTLLRLIAGLDREDAGQIRLAGRDITRVAPAGRDYGIVFQSYALFPNLTVADNIAYGLTPRRDRARHRERVRELLDMVGLPGAEAKFPAQLSGGQQQRVALARALATSPGLLLLDEPLSALDAKVRDHLRDELKRLQRRLGVTTLMVTHDQAEALAVADRVVVMNRGRIEQIGTPDEIYRHPQSRFVAEFVGEANWLEVTAADGRSVTAGSQRIRLDGDIPGAARLRLFLRPEDVRVREQWKPEANLLLARVVDSAFGGAMSRVALRPEGMPGVTLTALRAAGERSLVPGEIVPVYLPPDRLRVFGEEASC
ncbi:putative 2-aminoethylphosphonate ABC transporter ATP-binding protein [Paludibacterium paludis]|uniref:ABC transporter ATP-binding protein n=1 Tax=Paludibacterium paludis TaxID=1225769 RepID=A0A918NXV3_9NEIS|nr:putative 2-aminoethylphosphonate ABC transporter ATP-binding protein [Paludibacterium paludis]GGY04117.1 ABC transporter ATP-binding protein [Paludibacterium paludis]